jgi:hypothetical protein
VEFLEKHQSSLKTDAPILPHIANDHRSADPRFRLFAFLAESPAVVPNTPMIGHLWERFSSVHTAVIEPIFYFMWEGHGMESQWFTNVTNNCRSASNSCWTALTSSGVPW